MLDYSVVDIFWCSSGWLNGGSLIDFSYFCISERVEFSAFFIYPYLPIIRGRWAKMIDDNIGESEIKSFFNTHKYP